MKLFLAHLSLLLYVPVCMFGACAIHYYTNVNYVMQFITEYALPVVMCLTKMMIYRHGYSTLIIYIPHQLLCDVLFHIVCLQKGNTALSLARDKEIVKLLQQYRT